MDEHAAKSATLLIKNWQLGDSSALDQLVPILYKECRRLAQHIMTSEERPHHTLQATELVHEAFIKLQSFSQVHIENRNHLMNLLAQLMRKALIDHARKKLAKKREQTFSLATQADGNDETSMIDLLALDLALDELGKLDSRKEKLVIMKYFANMSISEIADVLSVSPATVKREWTLARAWLFAHLKGLNHETG